MRYQTHNQDARLAYDESQISRRDMLIITFEERGGVPFVRKLIEVFGDPMEVRLGGATRFGWVIGFHDGASCFAFMRRSIGGMILPLLDLYCERGVAATQMARVSHVIATRTQPQEAAHV